MTDNYYDIENQSDVQKAQLRMMRIQTVMIAAVLVIALIVGVVAVAMFSSVKDCIVTVSEKISDIESEDLAGAVDKLSKLDTDKIHELADSISSLAETMKSLTGGGLFKK